MALIATTRPGVYSQYELSSVLHMGSRDKAVAIVGIAASGTPKQAVKISRMADVVAAFGTDTGNASLCTMAQMLLANGCANIVAVPAAVGSSAVAQASDYTAALAVLDSMDAIGVIVSDNSSLEYLNVLKQYVVNASDNKRECIGFAGFAAGTTVDNMIAAASALNCERMVLVAGNPVDTDGTVQHGRLLACALAAQCALLDDPARMLSGSAAEGIAALNTRYSEEEIDDLIQGGVSPYELRAGKAQLIRAVTTRTKTQGVADSTLRELSTILVIDDVLVSLRDTLSASLSIARNNARSMNAIKTQAAIILERKKAAELIDSYSVPNVYADADDPTTLVVEVGFAICSGINQILVSANVLV